MHKKSANHNEPLNQISCSILINWLTYGSDTNCRTDFNFPSLFKLIRFVRYGGITRKIQTNKIKFQLINTWGKTPRINFRNLPTLRLGRSTSDSFSIWFHELPRTNPTHDTATSSVSAMTWKLLEGMVVGPKHIIMRKQNQISSLFNCGGRIFFSLQKREKIQTLKLLWERGACERRENTIFRVSKKVKNFFPCPLKSD